MLDVVLTARDAISYVFPWVFLIGIVAVMGWYTHQVIPGGRPRKEFQPESAPRSDAALAEASPYHATRIRLNECVAELPDSTVLMDPLSGRRFWVRHSCGPHQTLVLAALDIDIEADYSLNLTVYLLGAKPRFHTETRLSPPSPQEYEEAARRGMLQRPSIKNAVTDIDTLALLVEQINRATPDPQSL